MADVWSEFEADPRDPASGTLRASDGDREIVQRALGEAYAAGRLTREELDERSDAALAARTLGDLPPLLLDLAPTTALVKRRATPASTEQWRAQAEAKWRRERREAVFGALTASVICLVVWALSGMGFFWPGFVLLGTGVNVARVLFMRESMIEERVGELQRRQERAEARSRRREQRDDQ